MARKADWFMPLFAGLETVEQTDLTTPIVQLVDNLLPDVPACQLVEGLVLHLDASVLNSLHTTPDGGLYQWDNAAGTNITARQPVAASYPTIFTGSIGARVVNFKE